VNILESLKIALRALGRNKMRTGLTMLGMIIGVGAVITMVSLGAGATARVTASISSLGTNLLTVMPGNDRLRFGGPGSGSFAVTTLTEDDAEAIASRLPESVAAVAPVVRGRGMLKLGNKSYQANLYGTTPDYRQVNNRTLRSGRFITQSEVDGRLKVAVLGTTVVENLLGSADANPVGMSLQINRIPFRIIGVLKSKGAGGFGQDQDDLIVIPISTALRRVLNQDYINSISVQAASKDKIDLATEQITRLLRQRHRIRPPYEENDDFAIRSQAEILETFQTATKTMTGLLAGIAVVSLIVGGIGIMNIMLVSVSERTREIGLRKAVGATSRDVLLQFLIESCVIAGVGGIIGVVSGILGGILLGKILNTSTVTTVQSVLGAVGVATAIGLISGIYPAQKAAKLNPIEALRYE